MSDVTPTPDQIKTAREIWAELDTENPAPGALEKATAGSRELDETIDAQLGRLPKTGGYYGWERVGFGAYMRPTNSDGTTNERYISPPYTTSLDAAVSLVPEGLCYGFWRRLPSCGAEIILKDGTEVRAVHDSPALALVIASLRARSATP